MLDLNQHVKHILVVDDEDDCNFITDLVLKRAGFAERLTFFTSGVEALEFLHDPQIKADPPDILLVDINMPAMNGYEFMQVCERDGILPNDRTSVVMFSSSNRPQDEAKARSFTSVNGFVEKALTEEKLRSILQQHVQQRMG